MGAYTQNLTLQCNNMYNNKLTQVGFIDKTENRYLVEASRQVLTIYSSLVSLKLVSHNFIFLQYNGVRSEMPLVLPMGLHVVFVLFFNCYFLSD